MSATSRTKGQSGEREAAALIAEHTGWDVRRRVRQHLGDSDLDGTRGWCVEVKRHKRASRHLIGDWWFQAVEQARKVHKRPLLCYRQDRDEWRFVWAPGECLMYAWTVEGAAEAWAAHASELE